MYYIIFNSRKKGILKTACRKKKIFKKIWQEEFQPRKWKRHRRKKNTTNTKICCFPASNQVNTVIGDCLLGRLRFPKYLFFGQRCSSRPQTWGSAPISRRFWILPSSPAAVVLRYYWLTFLNHVFASSFPFNSFCGYIIHLMWSGVIKQWQQNEYHTSIRKYDA